LKTIKAIIGSSWGDEGKGMVTDYFCSQFSPLEPILNIRFSGGAQAGHTVVTPGGFRHVFSHFGAGSFNKNVDTYLAKDFIVNPILFWKEYDGLAKKGVSPKVYIHPQCKATLPLDMMVNQMVERHRGKDRHGSCGIGINETLVRNKSLKIDNVVSNAGINFFLDDFMDMVRADYSFRRLKELGVKNATIQDMELINNKTIQQNYIQQFNDMLSHCEVVGDEIMDKYNNWVFEGSQGLLLDKNNKSFFPNLTPGNTGVENILPYLSSGDTEVCYVTRSYFTRHGAGAFPTECPKENIAGNLIDLTNHYNEFQGDFRYGYFDKGLFCDAVKRDAKKANGAKFSLAVTHLDKTGDKIVDGSKDGISVGSLFADVGIFAKAYKSYGMSRNTMQLEVSLR